MVAAAGFALLALGAGSANWWVGVLPGMTVLGAGMTISIAPLTSTVMNAVPTEHAGLASGVNNAVARIGGLLAIALMGVVFAQVFVTELDDRAPAAARAALSQAMAGASDPRLHEAFLAAYRAAMGLAAGCAAASGLVAFVAIGRRGPRPAQK